MPTLSPDSATWEHLMLWTSLSFKAERDVSEAAPAWIKKNPFLNITLSVALLMIATNQGERKAFLKQVLGSRLPPDLLPSQRTDYQTEGKHTTKQDSGETPLYD